ncbi:sugar ABC transporter permease [Schumannella luteola]|uniref:Raffinose/stachyose/melibiose transport system permease protein n=1 Tax=Schumannella luteola TaxID=472059 RepID=A0A852YH78_9MICO|nr:sugar ABC transporter permease [Schumannella luteola]NYG98408.1 raffinose/stachyose/melibiose transport system permease protein [Schumannella luteola]TPX01354.1 sugar ABC transporter permease [Schumannella luteola]
MIWVALLPLVAVLGVFSYFPAVSGIFWSFFDWVPAGESRFIGLDNYARILTDTGWWTSFRNLGIIFVFSVVAWVLPLLAAELLITLRSARWKFVVRTLLVLPMAFPGVVTALVWGFFYDPNAGVINQFLSSIGLDSLRHNWTGSPDSALLALLFVGFPFIAGLPFLVFSSSLENIPAEVLEAAQLDGVGRWRRFWQIDLPLMASQVRILVFLVIVGTLQYGFAAYVLTGGGPDNATTVPVLWMIDQAFTAGNWGYAAALSTVLFALTMLISGAVLLVRRRASNADGGEM